MFNQAKQTRTFENVISQIQEAILEERLKPGDKLPGERTLREMFGVSRGTLREALRSLEQKGLVIIRTGTKGGTFVSPISTKPMDDSLSFLLRYRRISLQELAEFREALEGEVVARAAKKATRKDLKELWSILDSIKSHLAAPEPEWDEVILKDIEFHLTLARIAENRIFESVLRTVYDNIRLYFDSFLPREGRVLEGVYRDFSKVIAAIEAGDPDKAKSFLIDHVKRFNQIMEKRERAAIPKL